MQKTFIGILIIILAVVLFSLDNSKSITIDFWIWQIESNLSLVLIVSVFFGALCSFIFSLPYRSKKRKSIKSRDKKIKKLEEEIRLLENGLSKPVQEMKNDTARNRE